MKFPHAAARVMLGAISWGLYFWSYTFDLMSPDGHVRWKPLTPWKEETPRKELQLVFARIPVLLLRPGKWFLRRGLWSESPIYPFETKVLYLAVCIPLNFFCALHMKPNSWWPQELRSCLVLQPSVAEMHADPMTKTVTVLVRVSIPVKRHVKVWYPGQKTVWLLGAWGLV